jgi:lysozyme
MKMNDLGWEILRKFEGCVLSAYPDPASDLGKALLIKGLPFTRYREIPGWQNIDATPWTIGYGSTYHVAPGMIISQLEANNRLVKDVEAHELGVKRFIKFPLNDNQYSACICLAFNIGVSAFRNSTLLKLINEGKISAASGQFLLWNKAGGQVLRGLVLRRKAEQNLFLLPVSGG